MLYVHEKRKNSAAMDYVIAPRQIISVPTAPSQTLGGWNTLSYSVVRIGHVTCFGQLYMSRHDKGLIQTALNVLVKLYSTFAPSSTIR